MISEEGKIQDIVDFLIFNLKFPESFDYLYIHSEKLIRIESEDHVQRKNKLQNNFLNTYISNFFSKNIGKMELETFQDENRIFISNILILSKTSDNNSQIYINSIESKFDRFLEMSLMRCIRQFAFH